MQTTPTIWSNLYAADLRAAGPVAMLVASFLKYKANATGFFRMEPDEIGSAVGVPLKEVDAALMALEKIRFLRYDVETQIIWIIDHALWSLGKLRLGNKKDIATANAEFSAIPKNCALRVDFLLSYALMLRLEGPEAASQFDATIQSGDEV